MIIKFFGEFSDIPSIDLKVKQFNQVLAGIQNILGQEIIDKIYEEKFFLIAFDEQFPDRVVCINSLPDLDLSGFTHFYFIPEVCGEITAALVTTVLGVTGMAATITAIVANVIIAVALSAITNAIMSAITPTNTFSSDPSRAQTAVSSLFNGPVNVFEQGGSVPIVYGTPFCSGIVINSSITTEQVTV